MERVFLLSIFILHNMIFEMLFNRDEMTGVVSEKPFK